VSAIALYDEALERLGRGDQVGVAEMLKRESVVNAGLIEQQITESSSSEPSSSTEQLQAFLVAHDEANERLLALGFALIEYGDRRLLSILRRSVAHVIECTARERSGPQQHRGAAAVVVGGRLIWALSTYSVACDRVEVIATLARITIQPPDEVREVIGVFARRAFRYPQALGGNAGNSYEHYLNWLRETSIVKNRLPMFAASLGQVFAETDLLLALRMIAHVNHRTYSGGVSTETIRRLRRRFGDLRQRPALAELFESADKELNERGNAYWELVEFERERFWREDFPEPFLEVPVRGA
jgi:hypothetical protein